MIGFPIEHEAQNRLRAEHKAKQILSNFRIRHVKKTDPLKQDEGRGGFLGRSQVYLSISVEQLKPEVAGVGNDRLMFVHDIREPNRFLGKPQGVATFVEEVAVLHKV